MNKNNVWFGRGRIGKDPKYGLSKRGLQYLKFTMMTVNDRRTPDSKIAITWHDCIIWGKLADVVKDYCVEKARCNVSGQYCMNKYEYNGVWRYDMQVRVDSIDFIGVEFSEKAIEAAEMAKEAESEFDSDVPL